MKIVIDTKEDIHILRHVIQLLHAVSTATGARQKYGSSDSSPMFGDSSYGSSSSLSSNTAPPVSDASSLFGMFDSPSSDSSSIFPAAEEKKEDKGDFLDSLQVY
ncbi:hypothetical protein JXB27_04805 [Candidatus Woesearchaeota archaeon]|nr:hypothetical protein [Candidatus Woesearchaeota archaeon]